MIIRNAARRAMKFEKIPVDASASFAFLEFRPRQFRFNWHYHPEIELAYVVEGRGLRFVGDSVQYFSDGDLCLLGENLPHTWFTETLSKRNCHSMVIQFLPQCLGMKFLEAPEARPMRRLFERSQRGLKIAGRTRDEVSAMLRRMTTQRVGSLQHLQSYMAIMTMLSESRELVELCVSGYEPVLGQHANRRINQVLNLVNRAEPPAQAEAAAAVGMSPQSFSRFFRRCMQKTYVDYLTDLRLGRACRALLETDDSIASIAASAGFANLSNFNKQFRNFKRMTPREYRQRAT